MIGIVYGKTLQRANMKLEKVADDYSHINIDIKRIINKSNSVMIYFSNGDIWKSIPISNTERGNMCNIAYIDKDISKDIIEVKIMPSIKAQPFRAYNYFNV